MPERRSSPGARALAMLVLAACTREIGPEPIAFDRQPCEHCRMLISEPRFAAQLELEAADAVSFDDPGCLLRYRAERRPRWRAAWYHHVREERWIPEADVAFEPIEPTPMGFGLGAVDRDTPGALSLEQAEQWVGERTPRREADGDARR